VQQQVSRQFVTVKVDLVQGSKLVQKLDNFKCQFFAQDSILIAAQSVNDTFELC
jgi:hypothetical protein